MASCHGHACRQVSGRAKLGKSTTSKQIRTSSLNSINLSQHFMPFIPFGGCPTYSCIPYLFSPIHAIPHVQSHWAENALGYCRFPRFPFLHSPIVQNFINIHKYIHAYTRVSQSKTLQDDNIANRYTLRLY